MEKNKRELEIVTNEGSIILKYETNWNHLLLWFEKTFPAMKTIEEVKSRFLLVHEPDLVMLSGSKILEMKEATSLIKKPGEKEKYFRLAPGGFNFINNIRMKRMNNILMWLTISLTIIGIIQILILLI